MALEKSFISVLAASSAGVLLSVLIERLLTPRLPLARPWHAWALHVGLVCSVQGGLTLFLGRPWFAMAGSLAILLTLVLVNNAKVKALREPFIFQDYEYFTDAIFHPRLYIPFMGWGNFLGTVIGAGLAVSVGLWGEAIPVQRFALSGQVGGIVTVLGLGAALLVVGRVKALPISLDPERDLTSLGFLASLWRYGEEERNHPIHNSPFESLTPRVLDRMSLPHLVAVQSESFFDPRMLYQGIRSEVLAEFDSLKDNALAHGKLFVPAWGANTVRTEFSFLSGIANEQLGVHQFNPYRAVAAGWDVSSLACFLKRLGYRTICIHPYPASFYRRDQVCPRLGFDDFLDIRAFEGAKRFGPYISDGALADKISLILSGATEPVFVFAITMENHGPLHLERVGPSDIANLYITPPPFGCDDLTLYLRHIRNADNMILKLRKMLDGCGRSASLCWYGDHVPIMPTVYNALGMPTGDVEFVYWANDLAGMNGEGVFDLSSHQLAIHWLKSMGLVN